MQWQFEIGEIVELVGVYRSDKYPNHIGKIIDRSIDISQLALGGSCYIYVIDGVGTYGEGALKKSTNNE